MARTFPVQRDAARDSTKKRVSATNICVTFQKHHVRINPLRNLRSADKWRKQYEYETQMDWTGDAFQYSLDDGDTRRCQRPHQRRELSSTGSHHYHRGRPRIWKSSAVCTRRMTPCFPRSSRKRLAAGSSSFAFTAKPFTALPDGMETLTI